MNAQRLLEHYERIADSPDAVERLRQFVLDLALRGKLVPQDANDEPASELLKQVGIKTIGDHAKVFAHPIDVPQGWMTTTLGTVADVVMGQSPSGDTYNKLGEGVPLINGPVEFSDGPFGVTVINQYTTAPTNFCEAGDLLICVRGSTTGRTNVAGFRACIGRGVAAIQPRFDGSFIRLFVWRSREYIISLGRGIAFPSITRKQIEDLSLPLPPLAEQHRIVAKVDELMALCDRLEASRAARETTRDRLTAASLARLNTPDPETFRDDARFVLDALPALTARPDQIKQLRQTILNLAVRGKLVPQDPNDEPASSLLKRIGAEKAELLRLGQLKKIEPMANLTGSAGELAVPTGWVITDLQSICTSVTDGDHLPPPKAEHGVPFLVIGNVRTGYIDFAETRFVPVDYFEALDPIRRPRDGDLLYTLVGSYGIPVQVRDDRPFCVQRHIGILRPSRNLDVRYLACAMESQMVFGQATACATGIAQKTVPLSGLRRLTIPLPPLAEQHRIVAKVDELMTLCDRLETRLLDAAAVRSSLMGALLSEALLPSAPTQSTTAA
jgi:type I restriction enzyme, S subunit